MEQPSIPERLARIEVQLTHIPTRVELYEKLDELRQELRTDLANRIGEANHRMDLFQADLNHRMDLFQADVNRRFELLAAELQQQRMAINKLYVFIIGTALTSLTLGLGGMTLILTQLPIAR